MRVLSNILFTCAAFIVFIHAVTPHVHYHEEHEHNSYSSVLNYLSQAMENNHEDGHLEEFVSASNIIQIKQYYAIDLDVNAIIPEAIFEFQYDKPYGTTIFGFKDQFQESLFSRSISSRGPPVS